MTWEDLLLPDKKGPLTTVSKIELLYRRKDSWLWGAKFSNYKGSVLLKTGLFDKAVFRECKDEWETVNFRVEPDERIVGFNSNPDGLKIKDL